MIGNDIVDLQLAQKESNWKRPRFLQKIFTEEEQDFIHAAPNKDTAVWLLWSGKESVYKIIARLQKRRFFAPKKIVFCTDDFSRRENLTAKVVSTEHTFFIQSVVTDTHIHTIAQLDNHKKTLSADCFYIAQNDYKTQGQSTRKHLLKNYAEMNKLSDTDLSIQKDEWKIPHLYYKNKKQAVIISMAHHGYYGGYVLMMDDK